MNTNIMMQHKSIVFIVLTTALVLLAPLVAMQFSEEVNWGPGDFVAAAALLLGAGFVYELASRSVRNIEHKAVVGGVVAVVLLLVWVELAVGLFGTPVAGS